jgi:hypothetical protein
VFRVRIKVRVRVRTRFRVSMNETEQNDCHFFIVKPSQATGGSKQSSTIYIPRP